MLGGALSVSTLCRHNVCSHGRLLPPGLLQGPEDTQGDIEPLQVGGILPRFTVRERNGRFKANKVGIFYVATH